MTKTSQVREYLIKNPDANPQAVAEKFGVSDNIVYGVRKKLRESVSGGEVPTVTVEASADSDLVRQLRKQNTTLKRLLMSLLAEEL
jgi:transposase-like protein